MATNGSKSMKKAQDELIAVLNEKRAELARKYGIVIPRRSYMSAYSVESELVDDAISGE